MHLYAIPNLRLPQFAWITAVDRSSGVVTLVHGRSVEVRTNFFIEGVWNGPFANGDFGETDCVFGTGGIITDQSVRFVTSASTLDCLYYAEDHSLLHVSNSLPLLLARLEDRLDPHCPDYPRICDSILHGINEYEREIPTKNGRVHQLMYRNLSVSSEKIFESEKRMPPRFTSFEEYKTYRWNSYALIAANARDLARSQPLEIWSTQSTGYDCTAINVMAGAFGLNKVFTVSQGKSNAHLAHFDSANQPDDDGGRICEWLGLDYVRINRRAFAQGFEEEYLYYCGRHINQDANLLEIGRRVSKPGLLLTGVHGEILYSNNSVVRPPFLDSTLKRDDIAGHGMGELRLTVGFIHCPVPFIGARRKPDIVNITESSEMDPWRLGNSYDRPIARRIAEDAGIPREFFGQSKIGSVVIFAQPSIPYGSALRREFFDYLANEGILGKRQRYLWPVVRWVNSMLALKSEQRFAVIHDAERIVSKLIGRTFNFKLLWPHLDGALYCFCINRTADCRANVLRSGAES